MILVDETYLVMSVIKEAISPCWNKHPEDSSWYGYINFLTYLKLYFCKHCFFKCNIMFRVLPFHWWGAASQVNIPFFRQLAWHYISTVSFFFPAIFCELPSKSYVYNNWWVLIICRRNLNLFMMKSSGWMMKLGKFFPYKL